MVFGYIFDVVLIPFTVRVRNLLNHQKQLFSQWISMILLLRETGCLMIFLFFPLPVLALIFDNLLHRFRFSFGTPSVSIYTLFVMLFRMFILFNSTLINKGFHNRRHSMFFRFVVACFFHTFVPCTDARSTNARNNICNFFKQIIFFTHLYLALT